MGSRIGSFMLPLVYVHFALCIWLSDMFCLVPMAVLCQADRSSVIGVYMDNGEDCRVKAVDIEKKKEVLQRSYDQTLRKRTGREVEKSLFLKRYADRPDIIKKAKWTTIRTRDHQSNKIVLQQVTRIYDQDIGEHIFEDIEGQEISTTSVLDNNTFNLAPDQQERTAHDAFDMVLKEERGAVGITASELGESSESWVGKTLASSPPSKKEPSSRRSLGRIHLR